MNDSLLPVYTAHCFWGWCPHTEQAFTPEQVSRQMQAHYDDRHQPQLDRLGYPALPKKDRK